MPTCACAMIRAVPYRLIGHEETIRRLEAGLARDRLSHAYLILGPDQVGKRALALQLAMALNCHQPQSAPCWECLSCRKALSGNHPDLRVLGQEKATLPISEVRELQREISLSPVEGRRRVFVLPDFARASPESANALLKTLEEPPGRAALILTAQEPAQVLPTILSRCQVLRLRLVPPEGIAEGLRERGADPETAERLARLALGRPGWALDALARPDQLEERQARQQVVLRAMSGAIAERLAAAQELGRTAEVALEYVGLAEARWREALLGRAGPGGGPSPAGEPATAALVLRRLERTRQLLEAYVNPRLAMESLLLEEAGEPSLESRKVHKGVQQVPSE